MSNLSDIGFPTPDEQAVNDMIWHVIELAKPVECSHGLYLKFSDESGAEIYLQGNFKQELIGFNPHFAGKSRRKVGLTKKIERDSSELDGGFYAWANPPDKDEEYLGDFAFVFDVPDFRVNEEIKIPQNCDIQLTAFASNDFQMFANEEEYFAAQDSIPKNATTYFAQSGIDDFEENQEETPPPPRPIAILAGEIKDFELKINKISGVKFYSFLVETLGGEIDVVADPKLISEEPKIGGIVSGQFWLSGKILEFE